MTRCAFVLALLLCMLDAAAGERRVLFAVNDDGERVTIEPIVLLDPIAEPRMDDEAFARRYFAASRSYVTSFNGKVTGDVRTVERVRTGCVSMAASALLTGSNEAQFATNFAPEHTGPAPREATDDELRMLRRWGRLFLVHRGLAAADVERLEADVVHVDPGDGTPLFVGSLHAVGSPQRPSGVVFFIAAAADVTPTRVKTQYARFSEREPDPAQGVQWLFGTIDLDGDGIAELVTWRQEKEGHSYVVLRRKNGQWMATEGGGAGC
jgi:hypothetical protein